MKWAEHIRLGLFAGVVVIVYWLTARWLVDRFFLKRAARSRFERWFRSNSTGIVLLSAAASGAICIVYGLLVEPTRLTVTTYRIETPKIPPGEHVRLVCLADLHVRDNGPRERRLPELVRSLQPDLILYSGDFLCGNQTDEPALSTLLRSWDVPQYACEGNLDASPVFDRIMRETGVRVLNGDMVPVQVRGASLMLAGMVSGAEEYFPEWLAQWPEDTFNILLYHHPQGFPKTWFSKTDLMLAGHTHGGQVRLPGYGALVTLDAYGKRWEYGLYEEHGVRLIVSRGLGCEPHLPEVRFWCPPEVVVVELVGAGRAG